MIQLDKLDDLNEIFIEKYGFTIAVGIGIHSGPVRVGNMVYTSGQVSRWHGEEIKGKVGRDVSVEKGYEAAKLSGLACLEVVHSLIGSLDDVVRVVKVLGMVNVAPDFDDTPSVIHGCSDLLLEVFGENGRHARSAVGMTIPYNFSVEVEAIFEVNP